MDNIWLNIFTRVLFFFVNVKIKIEIAESLLMAFSYQICILLVLNLSHTRFSISLTALFLCSSVSMATLAVLRIMGILLTLESNEYRRFCLPRMLQAS